MSASLQKLFGKKPTQEELVRKWQRDIRTEIRSLDRTITASENAEKTAIKELKKAASKNDISSCKTFANSLVGIRKQIQKLHTAKAQLNSINLQLQQQSSTLKVMGTLKKTTEVMKMVNGISKLEIVSKSMQELSMEMTKAGVLDEMIQDTFENLEEDNIEEAADEEVNKVLLEITNGILGEAGEVGAPLESGKVEEVEVEEEEPEINEMQARLQALKT